MMYPHVNTGHKADSQLLGLRRGDAMPMIGPATIEEAMARIDEAEQEVERGEVYSLEAVMEAARERIRLYEHSHH